MSWLGSEAVTGTYRITQSTIDLLQPQELNGYCLLTLNNEDLKDVGVSTLGQRKNVLRACASLLEQCTRVDGDSAGKKRETKKKKTKEKQNNKKEKSKKNDGGSDSDSDSGVGAGTS